MKVTGRVGEFINGIQLHFADGTDSPMIGEDDGDESILTFAGNDPIAQIIFKTRAGNLYAVEFVSESGLREQLGRKE